jgi:hypothetical protein
VSERLTMGEFRRELLDLLGRATPFGGDVDDPEHEQAVEEQDDELPEGGVPTAALVVVEWQATDGKRWLSRAGVLGSGDSAPRWTVEMLAHEALTWDERAEAQE